MKLIPIALLLLAASCATRRLPATPSLLIIPVKAASCEVVPPNDLQRFERVDVRYTVETGNAIEVRRVEYRRAR